MHANWYISTEDWRPHFYPPSEQAAREAEERYEAGKRAVAPYLHLAAAFGKAQGYIDIIWYGNEDANDWAWVIHDVVEYLRRQGWTVEPPE